MTGIKDFRGKVVVVTGAGSGIGRATAVAFASEGAKIVLSDISEERLTEVRKEIEKKGAGVLVRKTDVSDRSQVMALADFVMNEYGRIDILHNNAGVAVGSPVENTSIEDWKWIFGINFWGVVYGIDSFLPYMISQRSGHIVNTASLFGLIGVPAAGAYCATKFAVVGLSEALRAEVRRYGIGVSVICPGLINTNIVCDGRTCLPENGTANRSAVEKFFKDYGRSPEKVARAVLKAVRKNKAVVPVGFEAWIQWFLKRISQRGYNLSCNLSARLLG
jgi:NAD(P)-dependent dehydrogenase (short-subunit alcohol dehydrogenase family)